MGALSVLVCLPLAALGVMASVIHVRRGMRPRTGGRMPQFYRPGLHGRAWRARLVGHLALQWAVRLIDDYRTEVPSIWWRERLRWHISRRGGREHRRGPIGSEPWGFGENSGSAGVRGCFRRLPSLLAMATV